MGILVFDVGTSSMRGVLMNEQADILCQFQEKYHPDFHLSIYVTQNPEIWRSVLYDIAKNIQIWCEEHGHKVEMISLTAQRTSMIPVDRDGNALCDAVMWQDKRNIKTCMRLAGYDGDIIRRSGTMVNPVFAGSKMAWLHENEPEIYDRSYKLFVVADYLFYHMTGQMKTDRTYASRFHLMNLRTDSGINNCLIYLMWKRASFVNLLILENFMGIRMRHFQKHPAYRQEFPYILLAVTSSVARLNGNLQRRGS